MSAAPIDYSMLSLLGIEGWVPVAPLPGALPSDEWVATFTLDESPPSQQDRSAAAAAPITDGVSGRESNRARLASILGQSDPATSEQPRASSSPAVRQAAPTPAPVTISDVAEAPIEVDPILEQLPARFRLCFIRVGSLLVVDSMPFNAADRLPPVQLKLLQGIARAVTGELAEPEVPLVLGWPPASLNRLAENSSIRQQAKMAVGRSLSLQLKQGDISRCLLMGESAARLVLQVVEPFEQIVGMAFRLEQGVKTTVVPSLGELLVVPGAKAELWCAVQSIRGAA